MTASQNMVSSSANNCMSIGIPITPFPFILFLLPLQGIKKPLVSGRLHVSVKGPT